MSRSFGYDRGLPIDRFYIENFLGRHAKDIRGRVLEFGSDDYTVRFGGPQVTKSDVLHVKEGNPKATFVGNIEDGAGIPTDTFDCVICTQVLQLIYDLPAAVRTIHRILKPGGVLLATVPGISPISHDEWAERWCWAFTTRSAQRLLMAEFSPSEVDVQSRGNVLVAASFLYGLAAEELSPEELGHHDEAYQLLIELRTAKPSLEHPAAGS
jgi:SAM-dependent methyltransferase